MAVCTSERILILYVRSVRGLFVQRLTSMSNSIIRAKPLRNEPYVCTSAIFGKFFNRNSSIRRRCWLALPTIWANYAFKKRLLCSAIAQRRYEKLVTFVKGDNMLVSLIISLICLRSSSESSVECN